MAPAMLLVRSLPLLSRAVLVLAVGAAACGTVTAFEPSVDAAPEADAAPPPDARAVPDAAPPPDAPIAPPDAPIAPPDAPTDTTPPDTSLVAPGPAATVDTTRTVAFASDEPGATFRCALDGAAPTPCGSPLTTPALADGAHVLAIAAVDPAGNVDPTPVEDRWRIDTSGPVLTISARPPDPSDSATATLAWRSDEQAAFTCDLDGVAARCGDGTAGARALSGLTEGRHRFALSAVDVLGNRASTELAWTVDRTPPVLRFVGTPPSVYATTITFEYAATEAVAFACTVVVDDTGATIERGRPCGTGTAGASTYGAALPGATLLRLTVEAIDDAGNRAAAIERPFCRGTAATCLPR